MAILWHRQTMEDYEIENLEVSKTAANASCCVYSVALSNRLNTLEDLPAWHLFGCMLPSDLNLRPQVGTTTNI